MFSSTRVPLFTLLAGFVVGLIVHLNVFSAVVCAATGFTLFALQYRRGHRHNVGIWLLACSVGMLRGYIHYDYSPPDNIRYLPHEQGALVRLRATVCSDAFAETAYLTAATDEKNVKRNAQFRVRVEALLTPTGEHPVSGTVAVYVEQFPDVRYGDHIELTGKLYDTRAATNPGQFDFAAFLARQGIYKTVSVPEAELTKKTGATMGARRILALTREKLLMALRDQLPPNDYALYATVLLGSRSAMSSETRGAFVLSGTIHLLVVSGLHLYLLLSVFWYCCRYWNFPQALYIPAILSFALFYTLLTGADAPILRSFITISAFSVGRWWWRQTESLNILTFAALVVLLLNPEDAYNAGFYLSFGAVLGIIAFGTQFTHWLMFWRTNASNAHAQPTFFTVARNYALRNVALTLAAMTFVAPLTLFFMNTISLSVVLANLIALPASLGVMLAGGVLCVFGVFGVTIPGLPAIAGIFSSTLEIQARVFATLPWGHFYLPALHWAGYALYAAMLLSVAWHYATWWRAALARCVMLILLTLFFLWWYAKPARHHAEITMLDVGNGTAMALETPERKVWMYDCGWRGLGSVSRSIVLPFLRSRGITRLEGIVLSHPDADHYNGVLDLADDIEIGTLYMTSYFLHDEKTAAFVDAVHTRGIPIIELAAGAAIAEEADFKIHCLGPPAQLESLSSNDLSIALMVECFDQRMLLLGDLETGAFPWLLQQDIAADLMQVPHHGSFVVQNRVLLQAVKPRLAVLSAWEHFPDPAMLRDYSDLGITLLHTQTSGCIFIRMERNGLGWKTWKKNNSE